MEKGILVECFNGAMEMEIQTELDRQTDEIKARKFPYVLKPQEVYADVSEKKIITLNLLENRLEDRQILTAIREIQRIIRQLYPESIYHRARCYKIMEGNVGWFSFVSNNLEEKYVHIMFVVPVDGRMMFGSYHFPSQSVQEETSNFIEMLKSIRIKKMD